MTHVEFVSHEPLGTNMHLSKLLFTGDACRVRELRFTRDKHAPQ